MPAGVSAELVDHVARGGLDRLLPSRGAEAVGVRLAAWAKMMPRELLTTAPRPCGVEGGGHVAGRPALAAEAGHEKQRVRHGGAEFG